MRVRAGADLVVLADRGRPRSRPDSVGAERPDAELRAEPDILALPVLACGRVVDRKDREARLCRRGHYRPSHAAARPCTGRAGLLPAEHSAPTGPVEGVGAEAFRPLHGKEPLHIEVGLKHDASFRSKLS